MHPFSPPFALPRRVAGWRGINIHHLLALLSVVLLAACRGAPYPRPDTTAVQPPQAASRALDTELVYDILLADIAEQRHQARVALNALLRATHRSHDLQLLDTAIGLAFKLEDYPRATQLTRLRVSLQPHNLDAALLLASAEFKSGQRQAALRQLVELTAAQDLDNQAALQTIASLLVLQQRSETEQSTTLPAQIELLDAFLAAGATHASVPQLWLTAAFAAFALEQPARFRQWVDHSLALLPAWEIAAMIKLIDRSETDLAQFDRYAHHHLAQYPQHNRFRTQYAQLLLQHNRIDAALHNLETVLRQKLPPIEAQYIAGLVYLERMQFDEAKPLLQAILKYDPTDEQIRLYLAEIELKHNRPDAAFELLQAIRTEEYYFDAQIMLSKVLAKQTDVDTGIRYLKRIDSRNQDDEVRLILEQDLLLRDYRQLERAKLLLDEALNRMPYHPGLLYNRGLLAAEMQLLDLHEQDMRTLISLQPDNAQAYNALGYTLADRTERYDEAQRLITKALDIAPNDAFILDSMGWLNYRRGNHAAALEFLRRAMQYRQDAEIAAHLGEVLWVTGDKRAARKTWRLGKKWAPHNTTLLNTLKRLQPPNADAAPRRR